jgi:hypothetical protein
MHKGQFYDNHDDLCPLVSDLVMLCITLVSVLIFPCLHHVRLIYILLAPLIPATLYIRLNQNRDANSGGSVDMAGYLLLSQLLFPLPPTCTTKDDC